MKVLHVVKDNVGGVFAFEEARALRSHGFEVTVILPGRTYGPMSRRYDEAGIPWIDVDPNPYPHRPRKTKANAAALRAAIAHVEPDLVHVHHVGPCLLLRVVSGRNPRFARLFEVHGPLHLEAPHTRRADLATRGPRDYYLATSRAIADLYRGFGVPQDRVFFVYSGSDTSRYVVPRSGRLRELLGLADSTPLVGMVAWMYGPKWYLGHTRGLKGHDLLIKAIPAVRRRHPDAHFVMIGGGLDGRGGYGESLKRMAARAGVADAVTFLGPRSDVEHLQSDLDVAVHPSRSDNPGGAVYTLLAGVPTAGSRVGAIPEIVRHQETGLLFDRGDAAGLAGAIDSLLTDRERAKAMALRGRELAREMFDLKVTIPRVMRVYEDIVQA